MNTDRKSIGSGIWKLNETLASVNEELMENGGELTPELEETLAKAGMSQVEIVDGLNELIHKVKAEDAILGDRIKEMQALKKSRDNAVDGLKRFLLSYMLKNGIEKIEGEYCKVSISSGKESVSCDDAALIAKVEDKFANALAECPPYYSVEIKVQKSALLEYLKKDGAIIPTTRDGNVDIPLASIVRNPFLVIK